MHLGLLSCSGLLLGWSGLWLLLGLSRLLLGQSGLLLRRNGLFSCGGLLLGWSRIRGLVRVKHEFRRGGSHSIIKYSIRTRIHGID